MSGAYWFADMFYEAWDILQAVAGALDEHGHLVLSLMVY